MVSVATKADLPIKLLWPKSLYVTSSKDFVMLGLGDVVIPGLFIALALRYDQARFLKASSVPPSKRERTRFSAPYFKASIVSYVLGLVLTMAVMHFTKHPQPALLYLRSVESSSVWTRSGSVDSISDACVKMSLDLLQSCLCAVVRPRCGCTRRTRSSVEMARGGWELRNQNETARRHTCGIRDSP